jgi:predicted ArsR family transcriptional regulator
MEPEDPATNIADTRSSDDDNITSVAALGDRLRRALYRYVVGQPKPVNRDQAAEALGIARHTAKFHLDRLVADDLLEVEFARPPGRSGPGAGRPAKYFRRAAGELSVSLPARHYDLAGRLLARAITQSQREPVAVGDALAGAAHEWGQSLGEKIKGDLGTGGSREAALSATSAALAECGYEPRVEGDGVTLVNCPFHLLAREYTDLVCGMNLQLIDGLIEGLEGSGLDAVLDPAPGRCCVRIAANSE